MIEETKFEIVEFDDETMPLILELFDNELTEEGNIIDKNSKEPISDEFTNDKLNIKNFGGVLASSRIFISKNSGSIAEYINKVLKK
ncbi:MAG: hypothetical protein PHD81_00755 [Candidatus Nanoarchaeia archaeon]|nr:hypothetical protein [Candidatus Nanoarchaeia archaeon]MDD5587620.1 hypothetical protein [Candidatus Nanoarchaeia archaeon]